MNAKKTNRLSRRLSFLLRHGAAAEGVAMDAAGWVRIADVLAWAGIERPALDRIVAENTKRRLQVAGERIRASQGHSLGSVPVTREALEASWERIEGRAEWLVHGTRAELVDTILQQGLRPMDRTHVHLSAGLDSRVGKRANVAAHLWVVPAELEAAGVALFRSPNGVYLCREVPPSALREAPPQAR